ncbi:glycosyltransferase family 39 protein [Leptodesmis sp.]|uniref:glycosyltransferase family 39 protein n=1 Tax=Leptodesmis sp. TaxID=3100501 RepID=UPI0040534ED4
MQGSRQGWLLVGILVLGGGLRFWHLDFKPLWMDEVITALFSLGHTYDQVPLNQALPLATFEQLFRLNPQTTCPQIVATVTTQSVHPPLFFCWMHTWMSWVDGWPVSWVWKLRALPALGGVGAIAAIYLLNRVAFFPRAGLLGAALMAVSPFAVYLSQEARHYTLPILLVILALLGLYHLLLDLQHQSFRPTIWLGWIAVNSLGFYVHYFFLLAFIAQIVVLGVACWTLIRKQNTRHPNSKLQTPNSKPQNLELKTQNLKLLPPLLAITTVCLTYLPWLPTFLNHLRRPETDWLKSYAFHWSHAIAPLYQLPISWVLMVIALPVEQQPWWIALVSVLLMVVFSLWLGRRVVQGIRRLWQLPETHLATWMLLLFIAIVVLQFLAIVYFLGKDLTAIPRYSFTYFPALIALVGASLLQPVKRSGIRDRGLGIRGWFSGAIALMNRQAIWVVVVVGTVSSLCVGANLVFQKPYNPERIAQDMRSVAPHLPTLVTMAYSDYQDVAMGLSFALGLHQEMGNPSLRSPKTYFALMVQNQGYELVWQTLSRLEHPLTFPLNLWVISPGLKRSGYHHQLTLQDRGGSTHQCFIDPAHYYRIGIPYQRYRCD